MKGRTWNYIILLFAFVCGTFLFVACDTLKEDGAKEERKATYLYIEYDGKKDDVYEFPSFTCDTRRPIDFSKLKVWAEFNDRTKEDVTNRVVQRVYHNGGLRQNHNFSSTSYTLEMGRWLISYQYGGMNGVSASIRFTVTAIPYAESTLEYTVTNERGMAYGEPLPTLRYCAPDGEEYEVSPSGYEAFGLTFYRLPDEDKQEYDGYEQSKDRESRHELLEASSYGGEVNWKELMPRSEPYYLFARVRALDVYEQTYTNLLPVTVQKGVLTQVAYGVLPAVKADGVDFFRNFERVNNPDEPALRPTLGDIRLSTVDRAFQDGYGEFVSVEYRFVEWVGGGWRICEDKTVGGGMEERLTLMPHPAGEAAAYYEPCYPLLYAKVVSSNESVEEGVLSLVIPKGYLDGDEPIDRVKTADGQPLLLVDFGMRQYGLEELDVLLRFLSVERSEGGGDFIRLTGSELSFEKGSRLFDRTATQKGIYVYKFTMIDGENFAIKLYGDGEFLPATQKTYTIN